MNVKALLSVFGINFFWNRIHGLSDDMFILDIRHYVATMLHPKYRSLRMCSEAEQNELIEQQSDEPIVKQFKGDLFSRYESNTYMIRKMNLIRTSI